MTRQPEKPNSLTLAIVGLFLLLAGCGSHTKPDPKNPGVAAAEVDRTSALTYLHEGPPNVTAAVKDLVHQGGALSEAQVWDIRTWNEKLDAEKDRDDWKAKYETEIKRFFSYRQRFDFWLIVGLASGILITVGIIERFLPKSICEAIISAVIGVAKYIWSFIAWAIGGLKGLFVRPKAME